MKYPRHFDNRKHWLTWLLLPLTGLYWLLTSMRRFAYRLGWCKGRRFPVPVIVVGNILVGGTGKTPFTLWLVDHLQQRGWRPGIVSRGYGGHSDKYPLQVRADTSASQAGDEALLLARRCACPVVVAPDRCAAVESLLKHNECDIVVSDDGLQHLALARDLEIVIMDSRRQTGNGFLLPSGPLRETPARLKSVGLVLNNRGWGEITDSEGCSMTYRVEGVRSLNSGNNDLVSLDEIRQRSTGVHAVCGIGFPKQFFDTLRAAGLEPEEHVYPDHHLYNREELQFDDERPLVMTEKDAVKCFGFALQNAWYVVISATPAESCVARIDSFLSNIRAAHGRNPST